MATVDTLKAYEALTAAEMPDKQARALVAIVSELQEARLANVATKNDFADLKNDIIALRNELKEFETYAKNELAALRSEMRQLESRLEAMIIGVKYDLLRWLIPVILAQGAFVVALIEILK